MPEEIGIEFINRIDIISVQKGRRAEFTALSVPDQRQRPPRRPQLHTRRRIVGHRLAVEFAREATGIEMAQHPEPDPHERREQEGPGNEAENRFDPHRNHGQHGEQAGPIGTQEEPEHDGRRRKGI